MYIYKLKYTDKETAIKDLLIKSVYVETETILAYGQGIQAIVELGLIVLDNNVKEPVYADGYHFDVMSENEIKFESEIQVKNPKHIFAS